MDALIVFFKFMKIYAIRYHVRIIVICCSINKKLKAVTGAPGYVNSVGLGIMPHAVQKHVLPTVDVAMVTSSTVFERLRTVWKTVKTVGGERRTQVQ